MGSFQKMNKFSLSEIKRYLVSKRKEVTAKIRSLDQEEFLLSQAVPEAMELGTYSWEADVNTTKLAVKRQLGAFLEKIETSLLRLNQGTYGKCEKCGRQIDQERLKIIPTASFCIRCQDGSFKHSPSRLLDTTLFLVKPLHLRIYSPQT